MREKRAREKRVNILRREKGLKEGRRKEIRKKGSTPSQWAMSTGEKGVRRPFKRLSSRILCFHVGSNKHQLKNKIWKEICLCTILYQVSVLTGKVQYSVLFRTSKLTSWIPEYSEGNLMKKITRWSLKIKNIWKSVKVLNTPKSRKNKIKNIQDRQIWALNNTKKGNYPSRE